MTDWAIVLFFAICILTMMLSGNIEQWWYRRHPGSRCQCGAVYLGSRSAVYSHSTMHFRDADCHPMSEPGP